MTKPEFLTNGNALTLADAAALLPRRNGKKLHLITLKRWIIRGCRGVRLAATGLGNEWCVTLEHAQQSAAHESPRTTKL